MKLIARLPTEKFDRVVNKIRSAIRVIQSRLMRKRSDNGIGSAPQTEFQQILEECLTNLSNGTSTVEESLARYPQFATELRPLLRTVYFLNFNREQKPALAYNTPRRAGLARYLPLQLFQTQGNSGLFWRTSVVFAMLAIAVLVTGTASSQAALPGDAFYGWKKMSEEVWRTFSSDRVATEIAISNRRISEMLAVVDDPERSDSAMEGYIEALDRLKSVEDDETIARIAPVLVSQHRVLRNAGIVAVELDNHLVRELRVLPASAVATVGAPTDVPAPTSPASQPNPTDPGPAGPKPTDPESDSNEPEATQPPATQPPATQPPVTEPTPVVTEPPPTTVPTEPPPTTVPTEPPPVPTEPPPTEVPTEPPPTTVPTEPPPAPTEPEATPVPPDPGITTPENTEAPGNTQAPENAPPVAETPQP